jgi:hypothetical protein
MATSSQVPTAEATTVQVHMSAPCLMLKCRMLSAHVNKDEEDNEGGMDTVSEAFKNIVRIAHDAEAVG